MKAKNRFFVFVIFLFFGIANIYSFDLVGKKFWNSEAHKYGNYIQFEANNRFFYYRTFKIVGYEVGIEGAPDQAWWDNVTTITSVPSGKTVELMAHSEKKGTIDGIEEYWYYCRFYHSQYSWEDGWIWGGLLKK